MVPRTAFKPGNKPWTTGKHRTEEEKEKIRNSLRRGKNIDCHQCGKTFYISPSSKRKYCSRQCTYAGAVGKVISDEHKKILSRIKTGDGNPQYGKRGELSVSWKGGHTGDGRKDIHNRAIYKEWRLSVFERDNFICQHCKARGGKIEAHHMKTWKNYPKLRYVISNGLTLCVNCHKIETKKYVNGERVV